MINGNMLPFSVAMLYLLSQCATCLTSVLIHTLSYTNAVNGVKFKKDSLFYY